MNEFIRFIREQGVVGLAVGFILGGAVSKVVSSLVADIVQPLLGLALGSAEGLMYMTWTIAGAQVAIGSFIAVVLDFLIIATVVFFGFKWLKLDRLDKPKV